MSKIKFGDVLYIKGRIGRQALKKDEYLENGDYYLVTGVDITDEHRIDFKNCYYVSRERYEMDEAIQLKEGDIIVTKDGTIGKIGIIENLNKPATLNSHLFLIRNRAPEILSTGFLFYVLNSKHFQKFATNNTTGSNIPAFTQKNISEYEIDLPNIETQKKIESILSNIDSKIRNNNKINSILGDMARELYEYRFIQFDFPDENGNPYKSSGGNMVWNKELKREIPKGWEVKKVKDVIQHINTGLNPRKNFKLNDGGNIKYITVKNLTTNGDLDFSGCDLITKKSKDMINKRSQIRDGDILFASIAPLGRCYLMYETPVEWEINESVFSIRGKDFISSEYLYMYFTSEEFVKKAEHSSTGSVFNGIRIGTLEDINILVPDINVINRFSKKAKSLYSMKKNIEKQNQKLTELRDFLLPMLMNGQVTVK